MNLLLPPLTKQCVDFFYGGAFFFQNLGNQAMKIPFYNLFLFNVCITSDWNQLIVFMFKNCSNLSMISKSFSCRLKFFFSHSRSEQLFYGFYPFNVRKNCSNDLKKFFLLTKTFFFHSRSEQI